MASPSFPSRNYLVEHHFNNSEIQYSKFLLKHSTRKEWTDEKLESIDIFILVVILLKKCFFFVGFRRTAMAMYLDRNIHLIGTANIGHG